MSYPYDRWSAPAVALILLTLILLATCNPAFSQNAAIAEFKPMAFFPGVSTWNGTVNEGASENITSAQISLEVSPGLSLLDDRLEIVAPITLRGSGHVEKFSSPVKPDYEPEVVARGHITENMSFDLGWKHSSNGAVEGSQSFDAWILRVNGTETWGPLWFDLHPQFTWLFQAGDIETWEWTRGIERTRVAVDGWGTIRWDDEVLVYFDLRNDYAEAFVGVNARWLEWLAGFNGPENLYLGAAGFTGRGQYLGEGPADRLHLGFMMVF
jgi:hypothetical protein